LRSNLNAPSLPLIATVLPPIGGSLSPTILAIVQIVTLEDYRAVLILYTISVL